MRFTLLDPTLFDSDDVREEAFYFDNETKCFVRMGLVQTGIDVHFSRQYDGRYESLDSDGSPLTLNEVFEFLVNQSRKLSLIE